MALTIGELVGFIDLDDSGYDRGLSAAERRMQQFQRGTDGRLRDLRGRFVAEGQGMGRGLGNGLSRTAGVALDAVGALGKGLAGLGVGAPAAAATTVAVGGMAAAFASAGVAVRAFTLAAGPQLESVTEASELYEKAQEAAATGAEDAAEKQQAYNDALAAMPPATRATAEAFVGLKDDFNEWSDSLSGTTMPIFTRGIEILRGLLPTLTPFVESAADAFGDFLGEIDTDAVGDFAGDLAAASGDSLRSFLNAVKNIGIGIAGILQAFLPFSDQMSGGFEDMTRSFAEWGQSLSGSAGFAEFVDLARQGAATLGTLAMAGLDLLVALGPLVGITSQVAMWLAQIVSAMPPEVLSAIATGIGIAAISMRLFALATAAATGPIGLVIAAVAILAVLIVQNWDTIWRVTQRIWAAIWKAVQQAAQFMVRIFLNYTLPGLIIKHWDSIWRGTVRVWNSVVGWLRRVPGWIVGFFLNWTLPGLIIKHWSRIYSGTVSMAGRMLAWVRGLPRMISSAFGSLGSLLWNAGVSLIRGLINGIMSMVSALRSRLNWVTSMLPDWKGPMSVDMRILQPSGAAVMGGFMDGISGQIPALRGQLQGLTSDIPGMTGPLGAGMGRLPSVQPSAGMPGATAAAPARVVIDVTGGDQDMVRMIRSWVRVQGRGDVQLAFGRGR